MNIRAVHKEQKGSLKAIVLFCDESERYRVRFYKDGYLLESRTEFFDDLETAITRARKYCKGAPKCT